jgi:hypothetical protein
VGWRGPCAICRREFELGVVYVWMSPGPHEVCERCLRRLCEWAEAEDVATPWRDAYRIYQDAAEHYTEPMVASEEEMEALSSDAQTRIHHESYLTPWPNPYLPR